MKSGRRSFMYLDDDRLKPLLEEVEVLSTGQRVRNTYPSYDHRPYRQNDKGKRHASRRFVRLEVRVRDTARVKVVGRIVCPDVLARLMVWAIIGCRNDSVVRLQAFVMRGGVGLVGLTACVNLAESLLTPERETHQA